MNQTMWQRSFLAMSALALLSMAAFAQRTTGTLRGQVLDPQSAVVAGATVTVTNQATGVSSKAVTTSAGSWNIASLIPGAYTIAVEAAGFSKYVAKDVPVLADQDNEADARLSVGATAETVEVTAEAVAVQTTSSSLNNNYNASEVVNLPNAAGVLNGNPMNLAILAPNVVAQPGGVTGIGGSVGGTRPRDNNFTVDGVDDNNLNSTGPNSTVIPDAVAEFALQTNQFSAEYGHSAGGQFNLVTKSGTNNWHGSGYEYFQNRNLNAMDNLTKQAIATGTIAGQPNYDNNRFGGNIGGPIIKNKWFIFGNYEYTTLHGQGNATFLDAPTASGLATLQGLAADPAVLNVLKSYPVAPVADPTLGITVNGTAVPVGPLTIISPQFQRENDAIVNSDVTMGKHQFGVRFLFNQAKFIFPVNSTEAAFNQNNPIHNRKLALSDTWTINDHWINDLRLQYSFFLEKFQNPCTGIGENSGAPATCPPDVTVGDLGFTTIGPADNQSQKQNTYALKDSASWLHGKHTLKFGGEYNHFIYPQFFLSRSNGDYWYPTMQDLVNDDLASVAGRTLRGAGSGSFIGTQSFFGGFVQDDFRVTRRLTLNLGLRYEYWTNPVGGETQALNAISSVPGVITFRKPRPDDNNIAPRMGFAYDPFGTGKWSIRGGGAIAYDVKFQNFASITLPPQLQSEMNPTSACGLSTPPAWCANPNGAGFLQSGGLPPVYVAPTTAAQARALTTSFIDDTVMPKIITWSLGVQHELYPNATMEVRYLGTRGLELPVQDRLNFISFFDAGGTPLPTFFRPQDVPTTWNASTPTDTAFNNFNPNIYSQYGFLGNITSDPPLASSIYHALSVNFTQKNKHGLTLNANYTWSHTIDDATNEFFTSLLNPRRAQDTNQLQADRSDSDLDVRHHFALALVYQVPNFKTDSGFLKALLNGYGLSSVYLAQSGQPVTLQSGEVADSNGNGDTAGDRVVLNPFGSGLSGSDVIPICEAPNGTTYQGNVGGPFTPATLGQGAVCSLPPALGGAANGSTLTPAIGYQVANPSARYVVAGPDVRATVGRNSFNSPGFGIWNLSAFKTIRISEGKSLQFKADAYNVLNARNYTLSNGNILSNAGVNVATTNPGYVQASDPLFLNSHIFSSGNRTMTLAAHFYF